jgi:hypothetical protein
MMSHRWLWITASTTWLVCQGFIIPSQQPIFRPLASVDEVGVSDPSWRSSSALHAEKRRRRRRPTGTDGVSGGKDSSPDGGDSTSSSSELPDFDLDDEEDETPKPKRRVITNPDEITPSMMGSADAPVGSIRDLLLDRSLEAKFEFDEEETDDSLPDLIALSQARGDDLGGKKTGRKADRRAAAIAAKQAEPEPLFANLPFVSDDKGKVRPVKVLEAGAWAGIILLFTWEIYLNSPFFDRAAPMAPVVFESIVM